MKLVLDTNVIVSAFINPNGKPSQVVKLIFQHEAELFYNPAILFEYETVMSRPKFSRFISVDSIYRLIDLIGKIGTSYDPFPSKILMPDESDRIFYDTAYGSCSFLISGNLKHYPKKDFILTPDDLLKQC